MKKLYFVLDTMNTKNGLHYPVVCPVNDDQEYIIQRLNRWAGDDHKIVNSIVYTTKKAAGEMCELWRRHYQGFNNLEFVEKR